MNKLPFAILGIIISAHIFILLKLIYFPYPELFVYPYLTNKGLLPYSQILDQHFPGPMFFPINLDNLGMNSPEIARVWSIGTVIIIQILLFFISAKFFKSKTKALLVNTLFLVWQPFFEGWVLWIDSFLPIILLPAFYALEKGNQGSKGSQGSRWNKWDLICGLLLGMGIVFKQTLLPLSAFLFIYIFWDTRSFKKALYYLFGVIIPVSLMIIYMLGIGVFKDFWFWTVTFNLTTYAEFGRGIAPDWAHFSRALFVFGLPFLILLKIKLREVQILSIFLVGTLIGLSTRFDFVHFQPALPFAILVGVYGLGWLGGLGRLGRLGFLGGYGLIAVWWLGIFYKGHVGNTVISFEPSVRELAGKVRSYTKPDEKIFVFGTAPHLYQMSDTLPAGDVFVFPFPWFYKESENRLLEGIRKDRPRIIVSDRTVTIEGINITDFGKDIDQYILQNYQKMDGVGTVDILVRR